MRAISPVIVLAYAVLTTACAPQPVPGVAKASESPPPPVAAGQAQPEEAALRGWYLEHAGQSRFQACGKAPPLPIAINAELSNRARAFGLQEDTPVYVRLSGAVRGGRIFVSRVDQFGSDKPVQDCAMTGVVIEESPQPSN